MSEAQTRRRKFYSPWFPMIHQYTFTRNDSWLNSFWIMVWGLFVLTFTTLWGFFIAKPIEAIFEVGKSMLTGLFLYIKLTFKFVVYGFMGFLNSREITVQEILQDAISEIRKAAEKAFEEAVAREARERQEQEKE